MEIQYLLFFVGHICTAFLITYLLSNRYHEIKQTVSISLVMFLSVFPDIDMFLRLVGFDIGHRTITHSLILSILIWYMVVFIQSKTRKSYVIVYLIAYLSHIAVGDIIIRDLNILYPLGNLLLDSGIRSGSITHVIIEVIILTTMCTVLITRYSSLKSTGLYNENSGFCPFSYHPKLDVFFYPILIASIFTSLFQLAHEFEFNNLLLPYGSDSNDVPLLILLTHSIAVVLILMMWLDSRRRTQCNFMSGNEDN